MNGLIPLWLETALGPSVVSRVGEICVLKFSLRLKAFSRGVASPPVYFILLWIKGDRVGR